MAFDGGEAAIPGKRGYSQYTFLCFTSHVDYLHTLYMKTTDGPTCTSPVVRAVNPVSYSYVCVLYVLYELVRWVSFSSFFTCS